MNQQFLLQKAAKIKLFILDVDGVLTDGKIWYNEQGEVHKGFHIHDGYGIKKLIAHGVVVSAISGRHSIIVQKRLQDLGITHYYLGQEDKLQAFHELLEKHQLHADQVAYMGDDSLDVPVMKLVGLSIAPANAVEAAKQAAFWQTQKNGGEGAAREACDLILSAQHVSQ
jgi:3-deoxy-D-manno-octulosonate 8-phosphate phosphatase (KDO 8-P phosphatase)